MVVIAGIDEAGYGPTLGPLVVAASSFRLEDGCSERRLDALMRPRAGHDGLRIGDSKRLYTSGGSIAVLETTTLGHAVLGRGALPLRMSALLDGAVGFDATELEQLPWYERLMALRLPRRADVDEILTRAYRQEQRMTSRGIEFLDFLVAPIEVPRFNRLTDRAGSKAWTLFYAAGRLIETLVARHHDEDLVIHVDRHGGRTHYAELLATFFPMAPLTTLHERRAESAYLMDWPDGGRVRIDFRVKADDHRTPVALASVVAKTVRELFMGCLNAWFGASHPELKPTAGYPTDARRFLDELGKLGNTLEDRHLRERLVRCR